MRTRSFFLGLIVLVGFSQISFAQNLSPEQKAKVDSALAQLSSLGTDPTVVAAVRDYNTNPPAIVATMTQGKWKSLSVLSSEVLSFARNPLAVYLKTRRTDTIDELFVSGAAGTKVAFFGKTTSWSHKGAAKHDQPMAGKTWIGEPSLDESSGKYEVQISFPVLDGGKPIGSIVIGLDVSKL